MNASTTLPFIPVCCVCGMAREVGNPSDSETEWWSDFDSYLDRHGLKEREYRLTHAYCPVCVNQFLPAKKKVVCEESVISAKQTDITAVILQTVRKMKGCELDALARSCPQLTWNQVFLEVDRLSSAGHLRVMLSERGGYEVTLSADQNHDARSDRGSKSVGLSICNTTSNRIRAYSVKTAARRKPRRHAGSAVLTSMNPPASGMP